MIHPDIWEEKFQICRLYDAFGGRFWALSHIRFVVGACDKTTGYELNFRAVDKGFIAPSDGVIVHKWQVNNVQLIFYTAGIM